MPNTLSIDPKKEAQNIKQFIRATVHSRGFSRIVIACSGGVDSSTSLFLAASALGKENVLGLLLPYKNLHSHQGRDAQIALKAAGVPQKNWETIDISPMVDAFQKSLKRNKNDSTSTLRLGNIMARCRMIVLFDRAKKHKSLVLGTENKSESLLGYFTRFGDAASDIEPIHHLYKTQVFQLASYLGVPSSIVKKAPTAGLWPGQTDEGQFGFSYSLADQILFGLYDQKKSVEQLVAEGMNKKEVGKVKAWVEANSFKHELPIIFEK